MPDRMPEKNISEDMPDRMPEKTVRRYARYTARKNVRRLPDRQIACQRENQKIRQTDMPERMSEDMPDRMLEKTLKRYAR
jgi:hypothetical protein